jgi:hyperosmotically inducible protein
MKEKNVYKPLTVSGIVVVVACLSAGLGLAGCEKGGDAEEAGRKMDQAAESVGYQFEEAKESMGKKAEQAGDYLDDASATAKVKAGQAGDYLDDASITTKVKAEIIAESALKVLQIDVSTTDGVVTLSGAVDSQSSLERASEVARNPMV